MSVQIHLLEDWGHGGKMQNKTFSIFPFIFVWVCDAAAKTDGELKQPTLRNSAPGVIAQVQRLFNSHISSTHSSASREDPIIVKRSIS
jgi:hypothetical protein